jgi:hypothetical protein
LVKSRIMLPQPWEHQMKSHTRTMKLDYKTLKHHKLHLDLTLTLIPNQSYAKMHWLCIGYAYAYSYYAYSGISIHECPYVHASMSNSCSDMDEHAYCMTVLCRICIKMNI